MGQPAARVRKSVQQNLTLPRRYERMHGRSEKTGSARVPGRIGKSGMFMLGAAVVTAAPAWADSSYPMRSGRIVCPRGTTERVSIATGGAEGNGPSWSSSSRAPAISGGGRFVAFGSFATNLVQGDTNSVADVFVRDRKIGTTERVSVATGGAEGDGSSIDP